MDNPVKRITFICPGCKSEDILEFDDFISCNKCDLDFDKDFLGVIDNENILARQELKGIIDAFYDKERKTF